MTGVITSIPPLVELPPGSTSSNPSGLPGVTYTAAIPVLPQTWTGLQTFTNGSMQFAGSTSGNTFLNATAIASGVLTLPAATDTLVGQNTVDTLTNKTLTSPVINNPTINGGGFSPTTFTAKDNAFTLQDDGDATKQGQFQLSGLTTATTRTLTFPDASGTIAITGNNLSAFAATTSAQLRSVLSDETGTGAAYFQGGDIGTPSAGVLTNATGLPISTGVSGLATGAATFLTTPSSANLRALLTDEVGTGSAYFVGGALGTPASGNATNLTGLPLSTGITGAGTGVLAGLAVNVGSAGAVVINGSALGTPSSGTLTNATGLPLSGLTTQGAFTIVANATGSTGVPTAMDVTALIAKASPVSADIVLIQDSAAANAFKKTTVGGIASAAGALPAPELAYWVDRAALLDPAAYVYWQGANWSVTVPTGETWYVVNAWTATISGSSNWFHRDLATGEAMAIPAGTVIAGAGASAFLYVCRPALVSADSAYSDPKGLYYTRLNTLRGYTVNKLSATVTAGAAISTIGKASFPTDFDDGLALQVSSMDVAWSLLANAQGGGGLNTIGEISDAHQMRFTKTLMTPFSRATFPQFWAQASNVPGNGTDVALAGYSVMVYYKLPGGWRTASPSRAYRTSVLADNPIVYYQFDETTSSTVSNSGSASLNGSYAGNAVRGALGSTGDGGTSVYLPDNTSKVTIPSNTQFDFGNSDFTIEMWLNFSALPTSSATYNPWVFNGWVTSAVTNKLSMLLGVFSNKLQFVVQSTDATSTFVTSTVSLATDRYYHVIFGRASGNLFIRVVNKETRQTTAYAKTIAQRSTESIWLGAGTNNGVDSPYSLNGCIDEFAMYSSLSDARADAHHAAALGWA